MTIEPISFFQLEGNYSGDLTVDSGRWERQWRFEPCPINPKHKLHSERINELHHYVRHNRRDERIIWGAEIAVHASVVQQLQEQGFTGFRTKPARVTFLDGNTSDDYREFIVTGWAGAARSESGMRVLESCPGCLWKNYGPIHDFTRVIDWNQWTGEDFFIVWPLTGHKLCTERVAGWLKANGIRSFCLSPRFEMLERRKDRLKFGIPRGPLSDYLPKDLAVKYGKPLGLE